MLQDQISQDTIMALKAGDKTRVEVLRYLSATIKSVSIDQGEQDDQAIQNIIRKQIKQIDDVLPQYQQAGRSDLVEAETAKKNILSAYLPAEMSDEELQKIIHQVVASTDQPSVGKVIPQVMKLVAGQASGGRVASLVNKEMTHPYEM